MASMCPHRGNLKANPHTVGIPSSPGRVLPVQNSRDPGNVKQHPIPANCTNLRNPNNQPGSLNELDGHHPWLINFRLSIRNR